jgi:hypothetical protein
VAGVYASEPKRNVSGLHRVGHNRHEIARQDVEIGLGAHADTEAIQGALGVVAAAIESAVDEGLDAVPERSEQRRSFGSSWSETQQPGWEPRLWGK